MEWGFASAVLPGSYQGHQLVQMARRVYGNEAKLQTEARGQGGVR